LNILKKKVTSISILVFPNNIKSFHIEVDSLDFATRVVFSQYSEVNGKLSYPKLQNMSETYLTSI